MKKGLAEKAIEGKIAGKFNFELKQAAEAIISVANSNMSNAVRLISIARGYDPRDFALVAFGGAGSMHAVWLAEELEINEIIVPNDPGTFSAWGMLQTDIRRDLTVNFYQNFQSLEKQKLLENFNKLKNEATELLKSENVNEADMSFNLTADMRYIGQEYYVNVDINENIDLDEINKNFHSTYEKQYGHSTPEGPSEFINLRLIATGKIKKSDSVKSIENDETIKD